jgi:hypothetical protein
MRDAAREDQQHRILIAEANGFSLNSGPFD